MLLPRFSSQLLNCIDAFVNDDIDDIPLSVSLYIAVEAEIGAVEGVFSGYIPLPAFGGGGVGIRGSYGFFVIGKGFILGGRR